MEEQILDVLARAKFPLHARHIRQVLAQEGVSIPEYVLVGKLRQLMREGQVDFAGGRWRGVGGNFSTGSAYDSDLVGQSGKLSGQATVSTTEGDSGRASVRTSALATEKFVTDEPFATFNGPWDPFRAIIDYYRDCIRNEGGSEALARFDELNSKFVFISRPGRWLPHPGYAWNLSLPLGSHLGSFISKIVSPGQDTVLILGYPLQVLQFQREGEPPSYLLKPIFQFPLEYHFNNGLLSLCADDPHAQVNLEWLNHSLRDSERQRSFLSACGFIGNDGDRESKWFHTCPRIEHLAATLASFMSRNLQESLTPSLIPNESLQVPLKTGIYNRAVIMLARRPKYTRSLLRELANIREATDEELDETALGYLFRSPQTIPQNNVDAENGHPDIQVAETTAVNSTQRKAVSSLLNSPITVITGPPGTGKSQVVSVAVANAHLFDQSVLFTSRNHKAIDAVYERCRDSTGRPLLARCNSRDDPNVRLTFARALTLLLAGEPNLAAGKEAAQMIANLQLILAKRDEKLKISDKILVCQEQLGKLEEESTSLSLKMPDTLTSRLALRPDDFPIKLLDKIIALANSINSVGKGPRGFRSRFSAFAITFGWNALKRRLALFGGVDAGLPMPRGYLCTPARLSIFSESREILADAAAFCVCRAQILQQEEQVKRLPDSDQITAAVADLTDRISSLAPLALEGVVNARVGIRPDEDRESFANLRSALQYIDSGIAPAALHDSTYRMLKPQLQGLLEHIPCWAVTCLSVGSRIPLSPGLFDLALIDEASQCDIPSVIPVLFRARRAGVVGDPHQLTHVTNLSLAKDAMLRRRTGLNHLDYQRFSYRETSVYSLFADTNGVSPIFLDETYRSVEEIAGYSNDLFYGDRLKIATEPSRFPLLPNMRPGIHWSEAEGEVRSGGVSGAYCLEELEVAEALVREILLENRFRGTLGIVTPFREQANRLRDNIFEGDIPWDILRGAELVIDTSHGFQGGEKDVILFSLCAGPGMPPGSLHFLRETGNLFNVAVSRARAVLHVIGNKSWALNCGISHIERLAKPTRIVRAVPQEGGPWTPHESPWEKFLFEALTTVGLSPIPQHPVAYRRLDLALIREEPTPLKIDIEVDGACCHRNSDGTRKLDDIWRDIQLQGMGWRVMRFWVYQLRENMEACVKRILEVWNSHG